MIKVESRNILIIYMGGGFVVVILGNEDKIGDHMLYTIYNCGFS